MSYTRSQVIDDVAGIIHSGSVNKVQNINSLFTRAARNVLAKIDPVETKRIQNLTNAVHDDVYDYTLPSDFKKIVDLRPQVNRELKDNFTGRYSEHFDLRKEIEKGMVQIKWDSATKSIRISADASPQAKVTVNAFNGVDTDGTWSADGTGASNVTADTLYYINGGTSINFDLASGQSTGYIENDDMTSKDLTNHDEKSVLFLWVYFPDASKITNVILRFGNSSSAYWSVTETDQWDSTAFRNGWNLLGFDWNGATETGTVDPSAIDYSRVTITYDQTAETDIRVDNLFSSVGSIYEIEYYSKFLFRNSSGTWQNTFTADGDLINLEEDSYNIFLYEVGYAMAQQLQGSDAVQDMNFFREELYGSGSKIGLYDRYIEDHPSEEILQVGTYNNIRYS